VGVKKLRKAVRVNVRSDVFPPRLGRTDHKAALWRRVFPLEVKLERVKSLHPLGVFDPGEHPLEVARRLLSVQYKTIITNVDGAIAGEDPEHLHRIRVAIRRLRGLLRVFRKCMPDTAPINETLRQLGDVLGPPRDLDVWVAFLQSDEVADQLKGNRRWPAFVQHHEQVRRLQQPTVRRELHGARFMAMRSRLATLLHVQRPPLLEAGRSMTLEALVAKRLLKEMRRVRDLAPQRHKDEPEKLHRLRVALRRARYVGESFGPVLGKAAGKLTSRLHQVEKPLAEIHDLEVGLSLIQHSGPLPPRAFSELLRAREEDQRRLVEPAWKRYAELEKKALREMEIKTGKRQE
jgi:CHAD domain-containing protein